MVHLSDDAADRVDRIAVATSASRGAVIASALMLLEWAFEQQGAGKPVGSLDLVARQMHSIHIEILDEHGEPLQRTASC